MLKRLGVLLALTPIAATAQMTYQTQVEYSTLYQNSTRIGGYSTEAQCIAAAQAKAATTSNPIRCYTSTRVTAQPSSTPSTDSDADGVPNSSDACPTVYARTANGCPSNTTPPPSGGGSTSAGTIQLGAATYSVNEGNGSVTITLKRVNGTAGAVGVTLATSGITATSGSDFTGVSRTVSWAAGDSADKTVSVAVANDSTVESSEAFQATAAAPTGGVTLGSPATTVVTIVDNDTATTPPPATSQPLGYYTDLTSAPVGAKVTAYGSGFGTSGAVTLNGASQQIVSYSNTKVVFTVSGSTGALVVGGKPLGTFRIHTGRVREATTSTLRSVWSTVQPGDVIYVRAGTYTGNYGEATYTSDAQLNTFVQGSATLPIALVAYPGESVTFRSYVGAHANFFFADGNGRKARYITIAGFNIIGGGSTVTAGGNTSGLGGQNETGAEYIRVVGNRLEILDASGNTMTGILNLQGDGWKVLGNTFVDPANRVIINNNHAVYIQNGADDVEVAYNQFVNLHMGHVIQVHQDGTPTLYQNISIHDNLLQGLRNTDMRGVAVGNIADDSTLSIERNTLRNVGQNFSGVAIYHGKVTVRNNLFYGVLAPNIDVNGQGGGTRVITATGNRFETLGGYPAVLIENGARSSDISLSSNRYCGVAVLGLDLSPLLCTN